MSIPYLIRKQVAELAKHRCEYCLIHEDDTYFGCEIDHIISLKHQGDSTLENLAFACMTCNRFKGSDLGSLSSEGNLIGFFNPRKHLWNDHFYIENNEIIPLTEIGKVTVKIFRFNDGERKIEREELQKIGHYPKM